MKNRILQHSLINIIFIFIFLYFPVVYGTIDFFKIILSIFGFLGLGIIGSALLSFTRSLNGAISFWILSYLLGGLFIGCLSVVLPENSIILIFLLLCLISIILLIKNRKKIKEIEIEIEIIPMIISVFIIFLYILIDSDVYQAKSIFPFQSVNSLPDPYFFTAITHSLSVDSIFNSFYDQGAAINYQIISFLTPSFFTKLFNIPAQVSLWGMWMPIYKLFAFFILSFGIKKFINHSVTEKMWFIPVIIILLFTLAPINPKYIINFDLAKIVFLGTGYILPGGNPPFTMAITLMGSVLIIYKQRDWVLFDGILYTCLLALIIGVKTALFIPFGIYMGILSLFKYNDNKKPLIYTLLAGILGACIYVLLFGNSYGLINISYNPGYYIEYFNQLFNSNGNIRGLLAMGGVLLIWGSIRWVLLIMGFLNNKKELYPVIIATVLSFLLSLLLPLLLRLKLIDPNGFILQDLTFDLVQFLRASFFLLSISSIIVLFKLKFKSKIYSKITSIGLFIYCTITLISNSYRLINIEKIEENGTWRNEVREESKTDGLFAIAANNKYSGQLLAAEGIGPWWFTCKRGDGSGYMLTNKNYYRSEIINNLLIKKRPDIQLDRMKREGVNYIVAHPDNIFLFNQLHKEGLLEQKEGDKWIFSIN